MKMSEAESAIDIVLEFGHTAVLKDKPVVHQSGVKHTHDWHLYVKARDGGKCENYIEKVVFVLHENYENPMRNVKTPPFEIKESGYGSFTIPIDLYFKTTGARLRKTRVNYELIMQPNKDVLPPTEPEYQHEIKMCRIEKRTFPGTLDEGFKRRLLSGGGKLVELLTRKDREEENSGERSSHKDKENEKSRERDKLKDRSRDREELREVERKKSKKNDRLTEIEKNERGKSKERDRYRDRSRSRNRDRSRSRNRDSDRTAIEIELELGHTTVLKDKPVVHQSGVKHTHDWHLYVKARDGGKCENYLEKVVFVLHETYENPMRNVKTPPFEIKESGYGSFTVPIDLYFKTTGAHFRKTRVNYGLVLQPNKDVVPPTDPEYQHEIKMSRKEKVTFPGTVDESFKRRLLSGGGKPVELLTRKDRGEENSKERNSHMGRENKKSKESDKFRDRSRDREELKKEVERKIPKENERLKEMEKDERNKRETLKEDRLSEIEKDKSKARNRETESENTKDRSRLRDKSMDSEKSKGEDTKNAENLSKISKQKIDEDKLATDSLSKSEEKSGAGKTGNSSNFIESDNIEEKEGIHAKNGPEESEKSSVVDNVGSEKEMEIKIEPDNGGLISNKRTNIATESQANKRSKLDTYCLLCQEDGHVLNDDCVVNAICLSCGVKGHVRRDCYCLLCQEYGHVLNDDCAICFNCGTKGHVRRDCPFLLDENLQIHHEIGAKVDAKVPTNANTDSTDAIPSSTNAIVDNQNGEEESSHWSKSKYNLWGPSPD